MKTYKYLLCLLYSSLSIGLYGQCTFEKFVPHYPYFGNSILGGTPRIIETEQNGIVIMTTGTNDTLHPGREWGYDLIKLLNMDSCGNVIWNINIGQAEGNYASDIIESDSGNFLIVARYGAELGFRVLKVNATGNLIWEKRYVTGTSAYGHQIRQLPNKHFLVSGSIEYSGTAQTAPLLMQIDENGNIIRYKEYWQNMGKNRPSHPATIFAKNDTTFVACFYVPFDDWGIGIPTYDVAIVKLDTQLNITSFFNTIGLVFGNDTVRGDYNTPYLQSVESNEVLLNGSIFKKYKNKGSTIKISTEGVVNAGINHSDSIWLSKGFFAISTNKSFYAITATGIKILDSNFIPSKLINYSLTLKGDFQGVTVLKNQSTIIIGRSDYRKVKSAQHDSAQFPYAYELYIVKMDSNGNFTPTTWNSLTEVQENGDEFTIYPNPANETLFIVGKLHGDYTIEWFDISGKKAATFHFSGNETVLNTGYLRKGLYVLNILDKRTGALHTRKVMIGE